MIGVAGIMAENIVQSKRLFDHTQATRHASAEPHNRSRYDDDGGSVVFFRKLNACPGEWWGREAVRSCDLEWETVQLSYQIFIPE